MLKEWPLVAFTVLGQTAVGILRVLPPALPGPVPHAHLRLARSPGWSPWPSSCCSPASRSSSPSSTSAIPLRARFALSNLRSSWLSREILFELVFMALVGAAGMAGLDRAPSGGSVEVLVAATALAGASFSPAWPSCTCCPPCRSGDQGYTPVSFFLTSFALGALATEIVVRTVAGPGVFGLDLMRGAQVLYPDGDHPGGPARLPATGSSGSGPNRPFARRRPPRLLHGTRIVSPRRGVRLHRVGYPGAGPTAS